MGKTRKTIVMGAFPHLCTGYDRAAGFRDVRPPRGPMVTLLLKALLVSLVVLVASMTGCLSDEEDWKTTVEAGVLVVDQSGAPVPGYKVNLEVWYLDEEQLSDVDPVNPGKLVHEDFNKTNDRGWVVFHFAVAEVGNYLIRAMVIFTYWIDDERGVKDEVTFKADSSVGIFKTDLELTV